MRRSDYAGDERSMLLDDDGGQSRGRLIGADATDGNFHAPAMARPLVVQGFVQGPASSLCFDKRRVWYSVYEVENDDSYGETGLTSWSTKCP